MTCEPSPKNASLPMELPSISSAVGSPARTSVSRAAAPASPESAAAYSTKWPASLANWSQPECCWKTSQLSLIAGSETFSEPWPRSGMMRNGIAYQLPPLAPRTVAIASGLWPTPSAAGFDGDITIVLARRERLKAKGINGNGFGLTLNQAVKVWPTPTARDWKDGSASGCKNVPVNGLLGRAVHVNSAEPGSLNPPWVEWLMGFPVGWTDLSNSETP
jgi:hypothetical protein